MAVSDGEQILVVKDMGLVSQVFNEQTLRSLTGFLAVGHTRYSTTGASSWENAQPTFLSGAAGGLALGHNGNLTNTDELSRLLASGAAPKPTAGPYSPASPNPAAANGRRNLNGFAEPSPAAGQTAGRPSAQTRLPEPSPAAGQDPLSPTSRPNPPAPAASQDTPPSSPRAVDSTNDTALIAELFSQHGAPAGEAALDLLPRLRGAYCLVFMDERRLYAARDPHGIHPLVLGRLKDGWVVASETCALDIVGAAFVRDVEPGEFIAIDGDGVRSTRFAAATPSGCLFEFVYLARPDTAISGRRVQAARLDLGRALAREHPAAADLVIPVPESGTPAAVGYAEASGIPFGLGLVKNAYVGRTFIQPSQTIRQLGVRLKLNPLRDIIEGKRLVVVDDSIVRGNTQRAIIAMLREAGAAAVHVRISSPPVAWPCFYGIDFATRDELLAPGLTTEQICRSIGADSLGYVSLDSLVRATGVRPDQLCRACFDGSYPVPLPEAEARQLGWPSPAAAGSASGRPRPPTPQPAAASCRPLEGDRP
jgi:amidophosphoribosyltransferase